MTDGISEVQPTGSSQNGSPSQGLQQGRRSASMVITSLEAIDIDGQSRLTKTTINVLYHPSWTECAPNLETRSLPEITVIENTGIGYISTYLGRRCEAVACAVGPNSKDRPLPRGVYGIEH